MEKSLYILLIIFITVAGLPVIPDGWHPIKVEDMETCIERKRFLSNYIGQTVDRTKIANYKIMCIEN
jgi:hypothetical protein